MLNSKVKEYLDGLDQGRIASEPYFSMHRISDKIVDLIKEDSDCREVSENKAEIFAFYLEEDNINNFPDWKTYYGPFVVFRRKDGQGDAHPSIKEIDQNMIEYWSKRATESKNPILSSRYADLVVDFSFKVLKKKADNKFSHIVIDSNIAICEKSLAIPTDCITKAKRALVLAIQTDCQEYIRKVKDTIINLEENIVKNHNSKFLGFAFQWLLLDISKKVILEDKEKNVLINDVEKRLKSVAANPLIAYNTVVLLAEYYTREKEKKDLKRVLGVLGDSLKRDGLVNTGEPKIRHASNFMNEIKKYYFDRFPQERKNSEQPSKKIKKPTSKFTKPQKIPTYILKNMKNNIHDPSKEFFGKNENLEKIMPKIAYTFLPQKVAIEKMINDGSNSYPGQYLINNLSINEFSSRAEEDSYFKLYTFEILQRKPNIPYLPRIMCELKNRFNNINRIIEYLKMSVVFESQNKEYLECGISAYWNGNYLVSSHLFISLIETGIRKLVKICGGKVWGKIGSSKYGYLSLGRLLENCIELYDGDNNSMLYFKFVLTNTLGFNLRNELAHGLGNKKFRLSFASNRLFHILILLSLVEKNKNG